mgnify:CR=1 FL=1
MDLKTLKKEYGILSKKYKLPEFNDLSHDFEIDKIDKDTDYLLRNIRKLMMEKIVNSMSFLEMFSNPMNSPRMYLPFIKTLTVEDRKLIDSIYFSFADLSMASLELEIGSSEKKEAELINLVLNTWNKLKPNFLGILESMKKPREFENRKERTYFG